MSQTITKTNLKAIHDIACSGWKTKIENYAKRKPLDDKIELSKDELVEIFRNGEILKDWTFEEIRERAKIKTNE